MRYVSILLLCLVFAPSSFAATYYVSLSGNNGNDGSSGRPWRTLEYAVTKVPANQGHTIQISSGTFVENRVFVPAGVSILGAGRDLTIIKANPSFYYYPSAPGFSNDKCLIQFNSNGSTPANQSIKNLTIDGDGKKLHGGIFINNRPGFVVDNVRVRYVNFVGIWVSQSNNSVVKNIALKDCAWGSSSWCSSALAFSNTNGLDISNFDIDEGRGYGIKNLGDNTNGVLSNVKIHHGKVSVHQSGLWNGGSAPNIAIELWANGFPGTAIYNTYVDNHVSIVSPGSAQSGTLKVYNNIFDILAPRTNGAGYCMEVTASNVEIYNNYFNGGYTGIVNWANRGLSNWNIHHNVFHAISGGVNPTAVISSYRGSITNLNAYNNTAELTATSQAVHFIEFDNSSRGTNVNVRNNLIINNRNGNTVVNLKNGGSVGSLVCNNNFFQNISQGNASGNYYSNTTGTSGILRSGAKPQGFYNPSSGGNLIDKGVYVGFEAKPDIGACGDNNVIGTAGTTTTPPSSTPVAVTGVSISPATITIAIGGTTTLSKTIAPSNATNQSVSWSSSNAGIARIDAASGLVTGVAAGSVTITVRTADGGRTATSTVTVNTSAPPTSAGNGMLTRAVWTGISGEAVSNLTSNSRYPATPNSTNTITSFDSPVNAGDQYGTRIYGYIRPTTSGAYTFWIAGDDQNQLYLSTTSNAANKVLIASTPAATLRGQLNKYSQQQSVVKNLVAGQYYFIEALHKEGGGGDFVQVYWQGPGIGQSIISSAYISTTAGTTTTAPAPAPAPTPTTSAGNGLLTRSVWNNLSGEAVSNLTSSSNYPNSPSSTGTINSFDSPINTGDQYGTRIYGYIRPTTSGNYTFWIAGDDQNQLYLSTTSNPANKVLIASTPAATLRGQLNKYSQQQSAVKSLVAGQYYFIEALHKEGGGSDFVQVYWQGPGIGQSIISSAYLSTTAGGGGGGSPSDFVSMPEEDATEQMVVYPVPVEPGAEFVVELPDASKEVRMLDMNGQQHRRVPVTTETQVSISSEGLRSGIYIVQVLHQRGTAFKKVMVK
jgi:hypothetical protein